MRCQLIPEPISIDVLSRYTAWGTRNLQRKGTEGCCRIVYCLRYPAVSLAPTDLKSSNDCCSLTENICKALRGEKDVVECAYVYLPGIEGGKEVANAVGTDYFAVPIEFGVRPSRQYEYDCDRRVNTETTGQLDPRSPSHS